MTDIEFIIRYENVDHPVQTHTNAYTDLRNLIIDKLDLEDFGQCGGMARCATCMVKIYDRLSKSNIYLACQVTIDDKLNNVTIHILKPLA